jgi:hypothetical protein
VPAEQEPLGRQLAVRVHHEATGDAKIVGQYAGRRQPCRRRQSAGPDGVAQTVGELAMQRFRRGSVEFDEQLWTRSGTRNCHQSGA